MAIRKTTKTATTAAEGMEMILATEPLKTIAEAAEYVGVAELRLLELLTETLNLPEAMGWDTLPAEHNHLLNEFKAFVNGTQAIQEPSKQVEMPESPPSEMTHSTTGALAGGVNDEVLETQSLKQEALNARDFLFSAEEDEKAQLIAAVKQHGWNVYERLGAELDTAKIFEIAQEKMAQADSITDSRLDSAKERLGLKTSTQRKAEMEAMRQSFLQQSQRRTQAWTQATSLKSSN